MQVANPPPSATADACSAELATLAGRLQRGEILGLHLIVIVADDEREYLTLGNITPTPLTDRHIPGGASP